MDSVCCCLCFDCCVALCVCVGCVLAYLVVLLRVCFNSVGIAIAVS